MEKINIAELLRDCPRGMELDCTINDDVKFIKICPNSTYPIILRTKNGYEITLTKYGQVHNMDDSKCVIFPKGKTTWEGFHRPFKDGDILAVDDTIYIYNGIEELSPYSSHYVYVIVDKNGLFAINTSTKKYGTRFATEEEKEILFKAIKDNGYEWNPESKTLEKLTESKEDTDDRIVMSGIYFDRENYADEVELHLNNYEIEIRDGKTYAVFKNTLERLIEPKFKVGDKIKHKNTVLTIISVRTNSYLVEDEPNNFGILMISQQDKWELINEPRFKVGDRVKSIFNNYQYDIKELTDTHYTLVEVESKFKYTEPITDDKNWELVSNKFNINNLKPFDKVLVRDGNDEKWVNGFFGFCDPETYKTCIFVTGNENWCQCIPYEGNEHLLGTTNDCDEYFKNW